MFLSACTGLILHLASWHFGAAADRYNEQNYGVGVRCGDWHVGAYRNSLYRTSVYGGRSWTWCAGSVCAGGAVLAVTGYRPDVIIAPVPLLSIGRDWRVLTIAAPGLGGSPGFVGVGVEIPLRGGWR